LNPNQSLSGQALLKAAQALASSQTAGPLAELKSQIAQNNLQTQGTMNTASSAYQALLPSVQQGVTASQGIANGLNSTLAGIGQDTQNQIAGSGQNALSSLLKYAPQGDAGVNTAAPAQNDLAAETARQAGLAAQQSGTTRAFGANQGANFAQTAASNLGSFGQQGLETIKGIGQSGTVKNQPLVAKIADLQAQQGALTATDLGKLRQQEVANQIARAGVGIRQQGINATVRGQNIAAANDQARINATLRGQNITKANDAARLAQQNLDNLRTTNTAKANNQANNSTRVLLAQMKAGASKGNVATGAQANAVFAHIDYVTGEIQNLISHGIPAAQAYHLIQNGGRIQTGTSSTGAATYRTYFPNRLGTQVLNAAYNVRPGGSGLTAGDLQWLASLGIKNPTRYGRAKATGGAIAGASGSKSGSIF
jgi:hypothetical protein